MSDIVWQAIIAGIVALGLAWMNKRIGKIAKTTEDTVIKVEESHKSVLKVEALSNGAMGRTLEIGMIAAQALAYQTGLPEHEQLATEAANKFKDHQEAERKSRVAATGAAVDKYIP